MAPGPDLLLVNANVLTMDPDRPRARAVAVSGGRITEVYAGQPDTPGTSAREVIDLRGATLIPGFHDAHNHMIGFGLTLTEADLRVTSLDELYARVAERAKMTPDGEWVVGSGYDQTKIGGHPHRDALDAIAPGKRVWLKHTSGHMCVVSSLVLKDLGIDATAQHVGGGRVGHSPVELAAYAEARDQGRLHVRAELMVAAEVLHGLGAHPADAMELGLDLGIRTGFGDDWLRLGPVKIFTDGSLVGRTAAMTAPFDGQPDNSGYLQADAAALTATIVAAHRAGWRVAAHAIGDRAIDVALDSFEHAATRYPRPDPRHRIEHFAAARPDQVGRAARCGVIAVPQ